MPGTRVLVLPCDLRDAEAVAAAVARVDAEWGGLDVLVPNAAATLFGPFAAADADAFEAVVDTNLMGNVRAVRAALPLLERSGGTIVATGSLNARSPLPDWSSYAASKHGLRGFYNTLRVELRASGSPVTVSQVHPGAIATPVRDVIMGVVHRYYLTGRRPAPRPGALVQPTARGVVRGTMLARPSLTSRLRFRR